MRPLYFLLGFVALFCGGIGAALRLFAVMPAWPGVCFVLGIALLIKYRLSV